MIFPRVRDLKEGWTTRVCHFVAKYSYGIYLWHLFGLWISFNLLAPGTPYSRLALTVLTTLAAAIASYHLIEAPAIRLGKNFFAARRTVSENARSRGAATA
jgi:peptidoglycan/LPS O-acetylase OafA/YrhL